MGRPGISYEEVAKAAQELIDDGERPTIINVRERLQRGSPNTITRHLQQWKSTKPKAKPSLTKLSPEFSEALFYELRRHAKLTTVDLKNQIEQLEKEKNAALSELNQTKEQLATLQTTFDESLADHQHKHYQKDALQSEHKKEIKRLRTSLSKEKKTCMRLECQLEELFPHMRKLEKKLSRLDSENSQLKQERDALLTSNEDLKVQVDSLTHQCAVLRNGADPMD